jgi:hypothetical protein
VIGYRARVWLDRLADAWCRDPEITPAFPADLSGVLTPDVGWRLLVPDGNAAFTGNLYELVTGSELAEFYAVLADGREITTTRPASSMTRTSVPAWQRRREQCDRA